MIVLLVGSYVGLLWLLVKFGVVSKWHGWMKISPAVVALVAFMVIFLPLSWNAPTGTASVTVGSVAIKPAVAGPVTKVHATSWTPIAAGDVLFEIEPAPFEAALQQAQAQLSLSQDQLTRKQALLSRNAVAETEVEKQRADVAVAEAAVTIAEVNLTYATVRAPFDGIVPAVTLLQGNQVGPNEAVMAFLDIGKPVVVLALTQNQIRNVKAGQKAEAVFKTHPGRTFSGTVRQTFLSSATAEYALNGATPEILEVTDTTYAVVLELDLQGLTLPPGSSGQGLVLTDKGTQFQFINQLTLRMTTWMNFF